ncbi:uncharacterized protein LOC120707121 isoform X3 [Panicum virgatum]|uniref:uncharacterized protein LOC120707121 isoform X3 n=1 Tax=Panicum virgatum TaxID=38727 RepID=UPI0019D51E24|nr:uncharacterized protein LOC120707121 isoform X3 [Panicum virgatum]
MLATATTKPPEFESKCGRKKNPTPLDASSPCLSCCLLSPPPLTHPPSPPSLNSGGRGRRPDGRRQRQRIWPPHSGLRPDPDAAVGGAAPGRREGAAGRAGGGGDAVRGAPEAAVRGVPLSLPCDAGPRRGVPEVAAGGTTVAKPGGTVVATIAALRCEAAAGAPKVVAGGATIAVGRGRRRRFSSQHGDLRSPLPQGRHHIAATRTMTTRASAMGSRPIGRRPQGRAPLARRRWRETQQRSSGARGRTSGSCSGRFCPPADLGLSTSSCSSKNVMMVIQDWLSGEQFKTDSMLSRTMMMM